MLYAQYCTSVMLMMHLLCVCVCVLVTSTHTPPLGDGKRECRVEGYGGDTAGCKHPAKLVRLNTYKETPRGNKDVTALKSKENIKHY